MAAALAGNNNWNILTLTETNESVEEEILEVFEDQLGQLELEASLEMENGNFAAYRSEDGYYIFKIIGEPYALKNGARTPTAVEGCGELPDGTLVCKGVYWNPVGGASGWYTPPPGKRPPRHIFRVRYVVHPDVTMEDLSPENPLPNGYRNKNAVEQLGPKKIISKDHDEIMHENFRRALMDFEEGERAEAEEEESDEEED